MLSLPMCLLALAQNASPKSAWVNRTSEGEAFGVSGAEVVRVMGTFNFALFYGIWVATALALCLGEWLLTERAQNNQENLAFDSLYICCELVSPGQRFTTGYCVVGNVVFRGDAGCRIVAFRARHCGHGGHWSLNTVSSGRYVCHLP